MTVLPKLESVHGWVFCVVGVCEKPGSKFHRHQTEGLREDMLPLVCPGVWCQGK